jgi:general secretion pathway protein D
MRTSATSWWGVLLGLLVLCPPGPAGAATARAFTFENADIQTVVKEAGRLTGITFLFDPEHVKGRITLLAPGSVSPAEALDLLKSALALHGYTLLARAEATWIVPAERADQEAVFVKVVPLTYARADELAHTLAAVAPPGVRIVPYSPTNSLIISGPPAWVEALGEIIK